MTPVPQVTFYGASGYARAIALLFRSPTASNTACDPVAFIDDVRGGTGLELGGKPIVSWEEWRRTYAAMPCLVAVGGSGSRRLLVARVVGAGGTFPRMHDPAGLEAMGVTAGTGTLLMQPGYIGPDTSIGDHVHVMPMHSIGHDVRIGSFATLAASVTVSGHVEIGEGAFIGAGATIINGRVGRPLRIGAGAIVAAGAVVTKSVEPGTKVMGNPARTLRQLAAALRQPR